MSDKPILFSAPMVRAILDGHKTQTRRLIKPPKWSIQDFNWDDHCGFDEDNSPFFLCAATGFFAPVFPKCAPGDTLWVKETWAGDEWHGLAYRATEPDALPFGEEIEFNRWKPSIFMPHWASRIDLEVLAVRAEWLQDITNQDAKCEGVPPRVPDRQHPERYDYIQSFAERWDEIQNKASRHASWMLWDANPAVWVYEFRLKERKDVTE